MENLENDTKIKYVGFGMRMFASVIDSILSIIILWPFFQIFNKFYGNSEIQNMLASGQINEENISHQEMVDFIAVQITSLIYQNIIIAIAILIFWIYCAGTPGKMILKMKIIDADTGMAPSKTQLTKRYIGYFISLLPLGLGFIWIHYDKKHQGWHDKFSNTAVVYK